MNVVGVRASRAAFGGGCRTRRCHGTRRHTHQLMLAGVLQCSMKAQRLKPQCPVCDRPVDRGLREHLYDHTKADLVAELLGHVEDEDEEE